MNSIFRNPSRGVSAAIMTDPLVKAAADAIRAGNHGDESEVIEKLIIQQSIRVRELEQALYRAEVSKTSVRIITDRHMVKV